jgi:hypothetical protein
MSETKPELKICSRCRCEILLSYFEINRKGELFKTCNSCRSQTRKKEQVKSDVQYVMVPPEISIDSLCKEKAYNEKVAEYKAYESKCRYKEKCNLPENRIICPKCGCSIVKYCFVKHTKEYKCIFFGVEDKPNREEWDKNNLKT